MALTKGKPNNITMCYHWARMIELLHSIEVIRDLLHDPDLQGDDLVTSGPRREEAVGVVEAPRGTLFHHYRVGRNDAVTMCNLIVSTTNNNEPMNRAVTKVARDHFSGKSEITEGLLNHIEVAIRAYDPCLSCATHALGQMSLVVEVQDADGDVLDRRVRGRAVRPTVPRRGSVERSRAGFSLTRPMRQPRVLVIGYGNPARGDDGLGPGAGGEARAPGDSPGVTVEIDYQLVDRARRARGRARRRRVRRRGTRRRRRRSTSGRCPAPRTNGRSSARGDAGAGAVLAAIVLRRDAARLRARHPRARARGLSRRALDAQRAPRRRWTRPARSSSALLLHASSESPDWRQPMQDGKHVILCIDDDQDILAVVAGRAGGQGVSRRHGRDRGRGHAGLRAATAPT